MNGAQSASHEAASSSFSDLKVESKLGPPVGAQHMTPTCTIFSFGK